MPQNNSDRFLLLIVGGIVLIVIVSFIVVMRRPEPQPMGEDTAQGVVHNYLLAIRRGDYEQAYSYLSPEIAYPGDTGEFFDSLREQPWAFTPEDNYSLVIEETKAIGDDSVAVTVRQVFNNNSLFGGPGYDERFTMRAEIIEGEWKLVSGERFWSTCWGDEDKCDNDPVRRP